MSNDHLNALSAAQMRQVAGGWGFGPPSPDTPPYPVPSPGMPRLPRPSGFPWPPLRFPLPCPIPRPWETFGSS